MLIRTNMRRCDRERAEYFDFSANARIDFASRFLFREHRRFNARVAPMRVRGASYAAIKDEAQRAAPVTHRLRPAVRRHAASRRTSTATLRNASACRLALSLSSFTQFAFDRVT